MIVCKNCDYTFEGKFCPNCSQKANTHRFSLMHFGHEFFHAVTHTDKGILFLMKELFRRPGKVALEYNAGKRKKYFNPITFLLIMMALQVYSIQKTDINSGFIKASEEFVSSLVKNSKAKDDLKKELEEGRQKSAKVLEYNKLMNFFTIPFIAFLTWLMFRRSGNNYAENLVFNILIAGQVILFFLIVCIIPYVLFPGIVMLVYYLNILLMWIYSFIAYKQFFKQTWGKTIFKGIVIQIVYLIFVTQLSNLALKYL